MSLSRNEKILSFVLLGVIIVVAIVCGSYGFKKPQNVKYTYQENNSVNYKVYYVPNNYFEEEYLEEGKSYITTLIDYIEATFNYNIKFSSKVNGSIDYQVVAEAKADRKDVGTGNLITKRYVLTPLKTEELNNVDQFDVSVSQKIDYTTYNDLMTAFVTEYGLTANSYLNVFLEVRGLTKVSGANLEENINTDVLLTIPLSQVAIDAKIDVSNSNLVREIQENDSTTIKTRLFMKVLFVVCLVIMFHLLVRCGRIIKYRTKFFSYRKAVNKIYNNYSGLISRVDSIPKDDYNIIRVESFEDILNVNNNTRQPINLKHEKDSSHFYVINGKSLYIYTMSKKDFEENAKP
jgi:hypothetical protein